MERVDGGGEGLLVFVHHRLIDGVGEGADVFHHQVNIVDLISVAPLDCHTLISCKDIFQSQGASSRDQEEEWSWKSGPSSSGVLSFP